MQTPSYSWHSTGWGAIYKNQHPWGHMYVTLPIAAVASNNLIVNSRRADSKKCQAYGKGYRFFLTSEQWILFVASRDWRHMHGVCLRHVSVPEASYGLPTGRADDKLPPARRGCSMWLVLLSKRPQ